MPRYHVVLDLWMDAEDTDRANDIVTEFVVAGIHAADGIPDSNVQVQREPPVEYDEDAR